jgi:hypothetical protein
VTEYSVDRKVVRDSDIYKCLTRIYGAQIGSSSDYKISTSFLLSISTTLVEHGPDNINDLSLATTDCPVWTLRHGQIHLAEEAVREAP